MTTPITWYLVHDAQRVYRGPWASTNPVAAAKRYTLFSAATESACLAHIASLGLQPVGAFAVQVPVGLIGRLNAAGVVPLASLPANIVAAIEQMLANPTEPVMSHVAEAVAAVANIPDPEHPPAPLTAADVAALQAVAAQAAVGT